MLRIAGGRVGCAVVAISANNTIASALCSSVATISSNRSVTHNRRLFNRTTISTSNRSSSTVTSLYSVCTISSSTASFTISGSVATISSNHGVTHNRRLFNRTTISTNNRSSSTVTGTINSFIISALCSVGTINSFIISALCSVGTINSFIISALCSVGTISVDSITNYGGGRSRCAFLDKADRLRENRVDSTDARVLKGQTCARFDRLALEDRCCSVYVVGDVVGRRRTVSRVENNMEGLIGLGTDIQRVLEIVAVE